MSTVTDKGMSKLIIALTTIVSCGYEGGVKNSYVTTSWKTVVSLNLLSLGYIT